MEFCQHQLDNGLEVVAECNPQAHSTAIGFFVNTGSRDETDEIAGVSHFLEHMAFKGTASRSAADDNREFDEMGSYSNARTGEEHTVYHATVLPEFQDRTVELLADIMRPALREDDFEMEKQVIIEEIRMYDDQPPFGGDEKCMAQYFRTHPLARSILGSVETVGDMTPEQMRGYFQKRYSPSNITLVAAGNVDFDGLVAVALDGCGSWERLETSRDTPRAAAHSSFDVVHKESATQQYVIQIGDGPAAADEDRHAARTLTAIVADSSGSRMYWELIETGRAEVAGMYTSEFQGTGIVMSYLCCAPEETADNLQQMLDICRDVEKNGVTEEELSLAKSKISSRIILQSERPGNRLFHVGSSWLQRREFRTVREVVDAYESVSLDAIASFLEKYPLTCNTTLAIGPLKELAPPSIQ